MKFIGQALGGCRLLLLVQFVAVASGCPDATGNVIHKNLYNLAKQQGCIPADESPYPQGNEYCWKSRCGQGQRPICMRLDTTEQ